MRIEYVSDGVGRRLSDGTIQLNKKLKKHPLLHKEVLEHELGHHTSKLTWENLKHDTTNKISWELRKFILTHPSTWTAFIPVRIQNRRLIYDPVQIFQYAAIIVLSYIIYQVIHWIETTYMI